jgi:protein deglycase
MDYVFQEINPDDYDALAIPGGFEEYGFYQEAYDERFLDIIRKFNERGKPVASICVGALPVGKSGVLRGRKATTYHLRDGYRQKELAEMGVNVINEPVVIDKNIITSWCPQTAASVAFELMKMMLGTEKTKVIMNAMGY